MTDPYDLDRFVVAQANSYSVALAELRRGVKRSHWMWYVFPQLAGLGSSAMSRRFAIGSIGEARAYLDHPVLGPRLRACVATLQGLGPTTAEAVFGAVDAAKFRSSLTLFGQATHEPLFDAALERWFDGRRDPRTLALLDDAR